MLITEDDENDEESDYCEQFLKLFFILLIHISTFGDLKWIKEIYLFILCYMVG